MIKPYHCNNAEALEALEEKTGRKIRKAFVMCSHVLEGTTSTVASVLFFFEGEERGNLALVGVGWDPDFGIYAYT